MLRFAYMLLAASCLPLANCYGLTATCSMILLARGLCCDWSRRLLVDELDDTGEEHPEPEERKRV
eukprot:5216477-Pleurochrysis_carterae.AAC.1